MIKVEISISKISNYVNIICDEWYNNFLEYWDQTYYIFFKGNFKKYQNKLFQYKKDGYNVDHIISAEYIENEFDIGENDIFVFEFENEEDSFYFKMKYC